MSDDSELIGTWRAKAVARSPVNQTCIISPLRR